MIELGFHTDNWRPLSWVSKRPSRKAWQLGLEHVEFAVIHGQNFIQAMGYDPGISLQSNPRAAAATWTQWACRSRRSTAPIR